MNDYVKKAVFILTLGGLAYSFIEENTGFSNKEEEDKLRQKGYIHSLVDDHVFMRVENSNIVGMKMVNAGAEDMESSYRIYNFTDSTITEHVEINPQSTRYAQTSHYTWPMASGGNIALDIPDNSMKHRQERYKLFELAKDFNNRQSETLKSSGQKKSKGIDP